MPLLFAQHRRAEVPEVANIAVRYMPSILSSAVSARHGCYHICCDDRRHIPI